MTRVGIIGFVCVIATNMLSPFAETSAATKRCDLRVNSTPSPSPSSTCLDLVNSGSQGALFSTAGNATRISKDSLKFCKNAFNITSKGSADIVFIMDNTSSMQTGDPYFCSTPGDPTSYRDNLVKKGMERVRDTASSVSAGFISFVSGANGVETSREQSLLNISKANSQGLANLNTLESKVIADSFPGIPVGNSCDLSVGNSTVWGPSFNIALGWFKDTTQSKTHNPAIVLISDGAVSDYASKILPLANAGLLPPVYGIHLGDSLDVTGAKSNAYANLKELSSLTGGLFFRIGPSDTLSMRKAMDSVIFRLVSVAVPPMTIQIQNTVSGQMSRAMLPMTTGIDGNLNVTLDSVLALKKDTNHFNVIITQGDLSQKTYPFRVLATGANAVADTGHLKCYDPASLFFNDGGQTTTFPSGSTTYSLTLKRSPSELSSVTVKATGARDAETLKLPLIGTLGAIATNQDSSLSLNGSATTFVSNNQALESEAGGRILFQWVHPRDPRDTAYDLVGGIPGAATLDRMIGVAKGNNFSTGGISTPVVIRSSVGYTIVTGDMTQISKNADSNGTNRSSCVFNCTNDAAWNATVPILNAPSFVIRTDAPFSFSLSIFDNLGRFVNKASGTVDATKWLTLKPDGTGAIPVVLSLVPVSKNGQLMASGVYILKASITTGTGSNAVTRNFKPKQFGFLLQ